MALSKSKLKGKILDIFTTKRMEPDPDADPPFSSLREVSPTMIIFAKELSDAYDEYAQDSQTYYAGDSLISTGKSAMKSLLETLDMTGNTAGIVASIISNSILLYWSSAQYAMGIPPGFSVVLSLIVHLPTVSSAPGLEAAMMLGLSDSDQADLWANAIHDQTKSVKTTHTGLDTTVPTPLPKTESNKDIL